MQFVLYGFEESLAGFSFRIVINAGGIEIKNLPVKHLLATANIADAIQQLLPVTSPPQILEAGIIHGEALHQILPQTCGSPDAKLGCDRRFNAITQRDNHVEVVKRQHPRNLSISFRANLSEFPTGCLICQFAFAIDVCDMFHHVSTRGLKQIGQLLLTQPD